MPQTIKEIKQRYFDKVYSEAKEIDCACGCGIKIKEKDKYGRNKKYENGHNGRKYDDPNEYKRQYLINNKDKHNERNKNWKKNNRGWVNYDTHKRRYRTLKATPNWSNQEAVKEIYINCPKGMHVDHIIPLVSEIVCGLHIETNLQYLTPEENLKKGNKFNVIREVRNSRCKY